MRIREVGNGEQLSVRFSNLELRKRNGNPAIKPDRRLQRPLNGCARRRNIRCTASEPVYARSHGVTVRPARYLDRRAHSTQGKQQSAHELLVKLRVLVLVAVTLEAPVASALALVSEKTP